MPRGNRRYGPKRDAVEPNIIKALTDEFGETISIHKMDRFDLLIGYKGRNIVLELKTPGAKLKTNHEQVRDVLRWQGEIYIVDTPDYAISAVRDGIHYAEVLYHYDAGQNLRDASGMIYGIVAAKWLMDDWWYLLDNDMVLSDADIRGERAFRVEELDA